MNSMIHRFLSVSVISVVMMLASGFSLKAQHTYFSEIQMLKDKYDVVFVYESSLHLDTPCKSVGNRASLSRSIKDLFEGSGIRYEIRGHTVILRKEESSGAPAFYEEPSWAFDTIRPSRIEAAWIDTLVAARVSADHLKTAMRTQTGLTHLSGEELKGGFAVFSSPDLIKTLQLLPGVASGTELMSGLFVHGGTGGDNLFLLDGSSVYNTSHLIGLFSAFNSDVIDGVDFYKSGFPARYGGRLSSVVDVTTRDGDLYDTHGTFSMGLIDGRIQWEGPLVRGKTSLQFGLRRTWLEAVSIPALLYVNNRNGKREKNRGNYGFWDLNIGLTHHLTGRDVFRFRFFNGMDRLRIGQDALTTSTSGNVMHQGYDKIDGVLNWGSTTAALTWNHTFSDKLVARTGAYYSFNLSRVKYGSRFWDWDADLGNVYSNAEESDLSGSHGIKLGGDFDWEPSTRHHVRCGAFVEYHVYKPERSLRQWEERGQEKSVFNDYQIGNTFLGTESSVYIEDEMVLLPGLTANAGMRAALSSWKEKPTRSLSRA